MEKERRILITSASLAAAALLVTLLMAYYNPPKYNIVTYEYKKFYCSKIDHEIQTGISNLGKKDHYVNAYYKLKEVGELYDLYEKHCGTLRYE